MRIIHLINTQHYTLSSPTKKAMIHGTNNQSPLFVCTLRSAKDKRAALFSFTQNESLVSSRLPRETKDGGGLDFSDGTSSARAPATPRPPTLAALRSPIKRDRVCAHCSLVPAHPQVRKSASRLLAMNDRGVASGEGRFICPGPCFFRYTRELYTCGLTGWILSGNSIIHILRHK